VIGPGNPARRIADPPPRTCTKSPNTASRRTHSTRTERTRRRTALSRESNAYALAAPAPSNCLRRGSNPEEFLETHQARAVPRSGVLLHAEGQADRLAAQGHPDRFRLCGSHPTSATARSAARSTARVAPLVVGTEQWRRGRHHHLPRRKSAAAVGLGIHRGHRQRRGFAIRRATRNATRVAICRTWGGASSSGCASRAKREYSDEKLTGRAAASGGAPRSTTCSLRVGPRRDAAYPTSPAPCIPTTKRSGFRPFGRGRSPNSGWFGPEKKGKGGCSSRCPKPIRRRRFRSARHQLRSAGAVFAPKRPAAVPGDRIVGILKSGPEGITIYPIQSPTLKDFEDTPERWARWCAGTWTSGRPQRFSGPPSQSNPSTSPARWRKIATVIAEHDGNIDNISMKTAFAGLHRLLDRSRGL